MRRKEGMKGHSLQMLNTEVVEKLQWRWLSVYRKCCIEEDHCRTLVNSHLT